MTFYLPDGQAGSGIETWTLVQNPNATPVEVTITYLTPEGKHNVVKAEKIPANSRRTFNMADHMAVSGRASVVVTAKAGSRPIVVERSMYWYGRGAGANTIGASRD
jgi:hypothetical protein